MDNLWGFLVNVNLFLQSIGDWIIPPMHWVTFLGDEEFYLLVMPMVYWCIDSRLGIRMGMILMLSNSLGTSLKFLFHSPRPFLGFNGCYCPRSGDFFWNAIRSFS